MYRTLTELPPSPTPQRPRNYGYLEIHRDMVDRTIEVPREIAAANGALELSHSNPRKVAEAARDVATASSPRAGRS